MNPPCRVLAVDDEPFVLKLLVRQLENLGFGPVTACDSAEQALQALADAEQAFDLVCCDLQMPRIDGVELIRRLAELRYGGRLLLVSGEHGRLLRSVEQLARAHGLDVVGTLRKPVDAAALQHLLANLTAAPQRTQRTQAHSYGADELRQALQDGQLFNLYQPKVALADGQLEGVETLVRWQHPQHGVVVPDRFVGVAEEGGLIDDLVRVVLHQALADSRRWHDAGLRLSVAVNVSMDNLMRLDFPDHVAQAAQQAGVPLSQLMLEVTESRLMRDPRSTIDTLTRLRLKRVSLSIDDFGTGHSSLTQLRDLPFDELKVDKSFVHGAWRDDALRSIVESNLTMARQLGMGTVAEGVEDRHDWDFLRQAGCRLAQGYFIARPMPAGQLLDWLAAWNVRRRALGD